MSAEALQCWFEPLNVIERGATIVVRAPDDVFQQWLESNYADVLADVGLTDCQWEFPKERNET